jgi:hypothetical protein
MAPADSTRAGGVRVLVAYGESHRSYREVLAEAIRVSLPDVEVVACGLDSIGEEMVRLEPHVVVCEAPNTVDADIRPAWVELPVDPERPARICIDGQRSEVTNLAFEELLSVVDRAARSVLAGKPAGC